MSQFGGVERPGPWETAGDHERRIRALEALSGCDPCGDTGETLEEILNRFGLAGLWKLDEESGDTAFDSSGNGQDMTVPVGYLTATWQQEAGPPGTPSALFVSEPPVSNDGTRFSRTMTAFSDDFSAGVWVNFPSLPTNIAELIGEGTSYHSSTGWAVLFRQDTVKFNVAVDTTLIVADNIAASDTWYLVGFTREGGLTTMYINGAAQADTTSDTLTGSASAWLGNDGHATGGSHGTDGLLSWAFILENPISASDWANLYNTSLLPSGAIQDGYVWTSDGAGSAGWEPPTIEVEF